MKSALGDAGLPRAVPPRAGSDWTGQGSTAQDSSRGAAPACVCGDLGVTLSVNVR